MNSFLDRPLNFFLNRPWNFPWIDCEFFSEMTMQFFLDRPENCFWIDRVIFYGTTMDIEYLRILPQAVEASFLSISAGKASLRILNT